MTIKNLSPYRFLGPNAIAADVEIQTLGNENFDRETMKSYAEFIANQHRALYQMMNLVGAFSVEFNFKYGEEIISVRIYPNSLMNSVA